MNLYYSSLDKYSNFSNDISSKFCAIASILFSNFLSLFYQLTFIIALQYYIYLEKLQPAEKLHLPMLNLIKIEAYIVF